MDMQTAQTLSKFKKQARNHHSWDVDVSDELSEMVSFLFFRESKQSFNKHYFPHNYMSIL